MQTGVLDTHDLCRHHREALLLGAVRVFCTHVQHDVARMIYVGFDGDPQELFRTAVKHQMMRGQGQLIATVVSKIIHDPHNTPVFTGEGERNTVACVMQDYNAALRAVRDGPSAYEQYKADTMLPGIMATGSTIFESEQDDESIDNFVHSIGLGIDAWPAFEPKPGFESIVHSMV